MLNDDLQALCGFLEKKANLLEQYNGLSDRLLIDDFDKLEHLLDVRHEFLLEFNEITPQIDQIVARCSVSQQETLKSLLKYEKLDAPDGAFPEIRPALKRMKALIDSINEKTRRTDERIRNYREGLMQELGKFSKGQRIASYVGAATSTDIFRGTHMDGKS